MVQESPKQFHQRIESILRKVLREMGRQTGYLFPLEILLILIRKRMKLFWNLILILQRLIIKFQLLLDLMLSLL
jgi:hypothetical protein